MKEYLWAVSWDKGYKKKTLIKNPIVSNINVVEREAIITNVTYYTIEFEVTNCNASYQLEEEFKSEELAKIRAIEFYEKTSIENNTKDNEDKKECPLEECTPVYYVGRTASPNTCPYCRHSSIIAFFKTYKSALNRMKALKKDVNIDWEYYSIYQFNVGDSDSENNWVDMKLDMRLD